MPSSHKSSFISHFVLNQLWLSETGMNKKRLFLFGEKKKKKEFLNIAVIVKHGGHYKNSVSFRLCQLTSVCEECGMFSAIPENGKPLFLGESLPRFPANMRVNCYQAI